MLQKGQKDVFSYKYIIEITNLFINLIKSEMFFYIICINILNNIMCIAFYYI